MYLVAEGLKYTRRDVPPLASVDKRLRAGEAPALETPCNPRQLVAAAASATEPFESAACGIRPRRLSGARD